MSQIHHDITHPFTASATGYAGASWAITGAAADQALLAKLGLKPLLPDRAAAAPVMAQDAPAYPVAEAVNG